MNFQETLVYRTQPSVKRHGVPLPDFLFLSIKMGLVPAVFFFLSFAVLTFPAITKFSTHFLTDAGDGLQNVWNIWWVEKAIAGLQSPWHTNYLHFPFGISLLGQTLNPFNGFVAIPLSRFLNQVSVFNTIIIFSFVASGLTAFFLAHYLTGAYIPSVAAGFIFTFSNYHFMHAQGHLQLVSMEWIPLFVLFWLKLLSKPSTGVAIAAATALFLVILCDYYYFFYCVLTGIIMFGWRAFRERKSWLLIKPPYLVPMATFCVVTLLTSGVLAASLLLLNLRDPLKWAHSPEEYGLDLLSPFIYGGHWRFGSLTQGYWATILGNINESSVYLGFSVIILLIFTWRKRNLIGKNEINMFYLILFIFFVLALGPSLHIWGQRIPFPLPLPYDWFVRAFPPLKISGMPVRMMVMVVFCAAMLSAYGFKQLCRESRGGRIFAALLFALLLVEDLPTALPMTEPTVPPYVTVLRNLSGQDGVLDMTSRGPSDSMILLYQTIHEKPIAFGYVSRIPRSVAIKDDELKSVIAQGDLPRLWQEYHFKYLVSRDLNITTFAESFNASGKNSIIWRDDQTSVIDLSEIPTAVAHSQ